MATQYPHWGPSQRSTVTASSQEFGTALSEGRTYILSVSTDCYFKVSATGGTAAAAAGSHYLPAGGFRVISPNGAGLFVQIIRRAADGVATLSEVDVP